ncbi:hypothetical protein ABPG75_003842 [Micractinium tetrahymenae]
MGRKKPFSAPRCGSTAELSALPVEVLALILARLPLDERVELAPVSKAWAEAVRLNTRGAAVDLRRKTREVAGGVAVCSQLLGTVALVSPAAATAAGSAAAAAALAGAWEPEESRLWRQAPRVLRPAAAAWHLRRAAAAARGAGAGCAAAGGRGRSLSLLLAAPEMDASTSELRRMLETAGVEGQICTVAVPQGLLRLDGNLNRTLAWANAPAAGLPAALQASAPYARLERLALKLSPSDDLPAVLGCIRPATLPALRCLALLAPNGAGMAADMGGLRHGGLARLDLRGLQLPAGFASLQQLSGLECLSIRYDEEDEAPPLNLAGDLAALSSLKQLCSLSLDNLGRGEGLPSLSQLTSLSLAPQQGARITLHGLPRLCHLAVDLSFGSCGRDLLSEERSTVHVPADHGLAGLQQLELRCFVWRHWEAAGSSRAGGSAAGSDAGSEASSEGSEASSDAGSDDGAGSEAGSEGSDSSMSEEGGTSEAGEEAGEAASSSAGSDASADSFAAADMEEVAAEGAAEVAEGAPEDQEEEAEEAAEQQGPGLLEASWGFLQRGSAGASATQQAHAMLSLEQRYIAALLARLPTLSCVQLVDYMGLVDPASLAAGQAQQAQQGGKPGAAAAAPAVTAAAAAAGKEAAAGSRAGSPGLVMQQEAGGAASSVAGWQRAVAETPVPGGISQYDVTYSRVSSR